VARIPPEGKKTSVNAASREDLYQNAGFGGRMWFNILGTE
jgi:hypothetical protein